MRADTERAHYKPGPAGDDDFRHYPSRREPLPDSLPGRVGREPSLAEGVPDETAEGGFASRVSCYSAQEERVAVASLLLRGPQDVEAAAKLYGADHVFGSLFEFAKNAQS